MSTPKLVCRTCGGPVGANSGDGPCAACMLERGLAGDEPFESTVFGPTDITVDTRVVQRFGAYQLLEEVGRGGMGVIYKAHQPGLDRVVALKMLLAGEFADDKARERLLREARIAARLSHPGIVTIHEVGEHDGRPYFAMEFVSGRNLSQLCRNGLLPIKTAVRYVEEVARAVHFAHQHGVIHRDLKPANVLVGPDDHPKLTDFGLTKSLVEATHTLESAGSPNFMAPEQADTTLAPTGTHTDVFGLGTILYYLLTGRPPVVGESLSETLRAAVLCEPAPPRKLRPALPADLETITLRCLERDPKRRYGSALEVAEELARWRNHEPIQARPSSAAERFGKWVRRRPLVAALSGACLLALVLGLVATTWQWRRSERQRAETEQENYLATVGLAARHIEEGEILLARELLAAQPERLRGWEWGLLMNQAHPELISIPGIPGHGRHPGLQVPTAASVLSEDGAFLFLHGTTNTMVVSTADGRVLTQLGGPVRGEIWDGSFRPDSQRLLIQGPATNLVELETQHWKEVRRIDLDSGWAQGVQYSPDGTRFLTTHLGGVVDVRDAESGRKLWHWASRDPVEGSASFSPDGTRIVFTPYNRRLGVGATVLQAEDGVELGRAPMDARNAETWWVHPDGRHYTTSDAQGVVSAWNLGDSKPYFQSPSHPHGVIVGLSNQDPPRLAVFVAPGSLIFYDTQSGKPLARMASIRVLGVDVGRDGTTLMTEHGKPYVRLWDWTSGEPVVLLSSGYANTGWPLSTTRNGRFIYAGSVLMNKAPAVHVWPAAPVHRTFFSTEPAGRAALNRDGTRVAVGHWAGRLSIWDARKGRLLHLIEAHSRRIGDVAWLNDGSRVVTVGVDRTLRVWDAGTGNLEQMVRGPTHALRRVAVSPDDSLVVAIDLAGTLYFWRTLDWQLVRQIQGSSYPVAVSVVKFSPDGKWLAACTPADAAVWNVTTGERVQTLDNRARGGGKMVMAAAFSQDGRRLASVDPDGWVDLWDTSTWTVTASALARSAALDIEFSPDGDRLFLASNPAGVAYIDLGSLDVHDGRNGRRLASFAGVPGTVGSIGVSSDGKTVMRHNLQPLNLAVGTDVYDTFPWKDSEFPGDPGSPLL